MTLLSYIFPQRVAKLSSLYNKEIRINEEKGKLKLLVNGSRQSGAYIELLWKEAFKSFGLPQRHLQEDLLQILVLGVAGGTVIHLLHCFYPQAGIVGVDIDQTMIDVGKQYFGLDKIAQLSLVCEDAKTYVAKKKKFDVIVVDLFIGTHVPELVRDESFLTNLKALLTSHGVVVINYLREFAYTEKSKSLRNSLRKLFATVEEIDLYSNRFFAALMVK